MTAFIKPTVLCSQRWKQSVFEIGERACIGLRRKKKANYDNPLLLEEIGYVYRIIATNSKKDINDIVIFYNNRGTCEYHIKEAKYGFSLRHLPSGARSANCLWFKTGMLAYNLLLLFKRHILSKDLINKSAKGLRYLVFSLPGKIVSHGGEKILKINCPKEMFEELLLWRSKCMNL